MSFSEWKSAKLGDACINITDGKHGDCKNQDDSGFYFVSVKDIYDGKIHYENARQITEEDFEDAHRRTKLKKNDILITNSGTIGRMALVRDDKKTVRTTFQKSVAVIKPNQQIFNPSYLYYCIQSDIKRLSEFAGGTTQKNLLLRDLRNFEVVFPALPEQKAIADTLSCLDDRIELNNRINKTLEEMAQAIFKSWFVDFEPFQDGEFEESELGRIPKGWSVGCADDILKQITNVCRRVDISNESLYVGLEHIPRKQLVINDFGSIEDVNSNKLRFEKMHILFGKIRPYFHKVSIAPWGGYCSTDAIVLAPKTDGIYSYAVLTAFSDSFVQYAVQISQGTKMPRSEWKILKRFKMVLPPNKIMESFNLILIPFIEQMMLNYEKNYRLAKIRDSLLPKLMSGEIQVPIEEVNQNVKKQFIH